jgi:hypothetical protein
MIHRSKVAWLKSPLGRRVNRRWQSGKLHRAGLPAAPEEMVERYAPGRTFIDVGGMWGIDGEWSFAAARAGAERAVCVDLYRTPEFDRKVESTAGAVEFEFGDASSIETAKRLGRFDVVWCFGVLYHHPNPLEILFVLREMCQERLVIETQGIPEVPGMANAAMFFPHAGHVPAAHLGISRDFDPTKGYTNNFWGPSPSALRSMLRVAGFRPELTAPSHGPFRYIVSATPDPDFVIPKG